MGKTTVTVEDDGGIRPDTEFADSVEVAIAVPKEEKRWRVGVMAGINTRGNSFRTVYGQYDAWQWSGKQFDLAMPVRVEWTVGNGGRVIAGIELRF